MDYQKRELGKLVEILKEGDTLICTELSRLGRSLTMIFNLMQLLADKKVKVIAIKNNFILTENDITSKVLMFAFGLSAEIERQLISERTKQGLERAKLNGKKIGHCKGYKCTNVKLTPYKDEILFMLQSGSSIFNIAKKYDAKWITARNFIRDRLNYDISTIKSVSDYRQNCKKKRMM